MASFTPDHTLGEGEHMWVATPQGLVGISTFVGTSVTVYDDVDRNPLTQVHLREDSTSADEHHCASCDGHSCDVP